MPRRDIRGQELKAHRRAGSAACAGPAQAESRCHIPARVAGPLLIAALVVVFLGRALFTGDVLLPANYLSHFQPWQALRPSPEHWNALAWDAVAQYYPWRAFARDALAHGVIPLWNPFQFCGMPFVANSQSAVFYPLNVLFYLFDPARAFAISAALHLLLGGCFTYALLRALGRGRYGAAFGGITFAFCAFTVTWMQLPTVLDTAVWLPLALWCVTRYFATQRSCYVVGGGFALGTALLAGHPQMFLYVVGGTALYFAYCGLSSAPAHGWRPARIGIWVAAGAAAGALALALGAVQLLPSVELFPFSHRAAAASAQGYRSYLESAMPWQHLVTLILPEFMGNPVHGTYVGGGNLAEYAAYAGVVPLLLAVLGVIWRRDRHTICFAALAVFALLVALGTPLNLLVYRIPGFSTMGGPARVLLVYCAALAVLAGNGADAAARALTDAGAARRFAGHFAIGAAAVAVIVSGFNVALAPLLKFIASELGQPPWSLLGAAGGNILVAVLSSTICIAALWAAGRAGPTARKAVLVVVLAAAVAELFAFGMGYPRTAPRSRVYPPTPVTSYLRERAGVGRIMPLYESWGFFEFPRAVLPPNSAMVYGLYDIQGYDSLYLARYRSVAAAVQGRDPSPYANGNMLLGTLSDPLRLAPLGVQYVLSQAPRSAPGLTLERAGEVNIYRVENFVPRAYTARRAVAAADLLDALPRLGEVARGAVVLEGIRQPDGTTSSEPANKVSGWRGRDVTFLAQGINHMRLDAPSAGWLVLSDAHYPGWRAWVEGRPARIHIANGAFRAVWVRPGEHEVLMRFAPTSFRLGLFATLVAAAVGMCAVGIGAACRTRR